MRGRPSRRAFFAAIAVLAICGALASSRAVASEDAADAPEVPTITTVLYPGWNMLGWVGPEKRALELFEQLPALGGIFAWDAETQRYQLRTRTNVQRHDLRQLSPGHGLWLYLGGADAVEWTRPVSDDSVLLKLRAGRDLVGWTGDDGTPIGEAVARLGGALERVWQWDAEAQEYRLYHPRARTNSLTEVNRGDAILVDLSRDARWWHPGAGPGPVVFVSDFPEDRRAQVRAWADNARQIFAERWGVQAPFTAYVGDQESLHATHLRIQGGPAPDGLCVHRADSNMYVRDICLDLGQAAFLRQYFGVLRGHLSWTDTSAPAWMFAGSQAYIEAVFNGLESELLTSQERVDLQRRQDTATLRRHGRLPLADLEHSPAYDSEDINSIRSRRALSFMAAATLAERTSEYSIFQFFSALSDGVDWREAFALEFGITVDDFYEQFEAHISRIAPPLPHLTGDRREPVLVFADGTPADTESAFREEFAGLLTFFNERLEADPMKYSVYVEADSASFRARYEEVFGYEPREGNCEDSFLLVAVLVDVSCGEAPYQLDRHHFQFVRTQLAKGTWPQGPHWFRTGAQAYAEYAYQATAGRAELDALRIREISRAGTAGPLRRHEERRGFEKDYSSSLALTFLAVDWLVERAGEPAIFQYYRLLPDATSWEEAFEAAFSITIGNFYELFEEYRAEVAPRFPHLSDDSSEPALALVGDVSAKVREAIRAEFDALRTFYRDRFGAGTADYTVYIATGGEPLAGVHRRVFNSEPAEGFCDAWNYRGVAVVALSCHSDAPYGLAPYHFRAINLQVTYEFRWGPRWISEGGQAYVQYAYEAARGRAEPDAIRSRELSRATATARPLETLDTDAAFGEVGRAEARALSFLAVEWLVERAGEPAIFEYYRLREEYYRLRASLRSWEEAFEAAFGTAVNDFYEAFEAYRAEVAP